MRVAVPMTGGTIPNHLGHCERFLLADVDGWLDFVLGGALDDTEVRGLAVFGWKGRLYAIAVGFNREGRPRSGAFDFAEDKVLFPVPPELRAAARALRAQLGLLRATPLESPAP